MDRGSLLTAWCATLALLGAGALSAGCGEPDPVDDRDGILRLELSEYRLRPQVIKTSRQRIAIVARNTGRLPHNVAVEEELEAEGTRRRPRVLGSTPTARPGRTVRTEEPIVLPPGRYRLACTVGNHDNLGQYGTLIVTE